MRKTIVDKLVANYPRLAIRLDKLSKPENEAIEYIRKANMLVTNASSPSVPDRVWREYDDCLKGLRNSIEGYTGKYLEFFQKEIIILQDRQKMVLGY